MSRRFLYLIGLLSLVWVTLSASCGVGSNPETTSPTTTSANEDVARALQLYAQREDLMKIREGIVSLRQAITKDPGNYDAAWQLAKFDYYLAMHPDDGTERDKAFRDGIASGKAAVQLQNDKPDGHFWLGANYGGAAQHSAIQGLATVNDIRNEMETVLRLNEGYQNGSAYMVLGLVYLNAPSIVGGDPKQAVELMEKGLRFGEENAFLHLHLAEAYAKVGRTNDARKQVDVIRSMKPDQDYLPEYKEASNAANKLSETLQQ
ncbi:MAG TPA: TRAP transporter TatT component family protein [Pyrinomonadaceae bacterium]